MEIVCIDDHHSQSAAVNVKNGTSWYLDPVIPYGTKKRDFANQTVTGAAVMGAFSISVVNEAMNQLDQIFNAADAGQSIFSGVALA